MTLLPRTLLGLALTAALGTAVAAPPATPGTVASSAVPTGPLPRTVVPDLVRLELRMDPRQARFQGSTSLEVTVAEPTAIVWMHGRDLAIRSVEYTDGAGARYPGRAEQVDVSGVLKLAFDRPLPAGKGTLAIAFEAPFGQLQGAYRVKPDGRDYVVTQMEPLGARNTFPSFDEPSFKQPWEITLVVPQDDIAVANSNEVKTEVLADGWKKVTFARTEAIPSYLVAFALGPWDVVDGPDVAPNGARTAPVKLRGIAAKGQGGRMQYSLAHTPEMVVALENYFGFPYPFDKLDNVAAPDFWAGAMENPGLIVYRDSLMFVDGNSAVSRRRGYWNTSVHELAHQWFGNLVTMKWWDDLWLNEGFATWMAAKIHGQLQPQAHTDRNLLEGAIGAMGADSLASVRRIHQPIRDFTDIQSAFDGITYQKGGATLAMFERYIGEDNFRTGVRNYMKKHARGNATSADLIEALAAQSNDPKAFALAFFSFIDQPGVPFVKVALDCGKGTPALEVSQQRYLPIGSTANAAQTWGIPLSVRYADGDTVREHKTFMTGAQARIELRDAKSCPRWVMPNASGSGYYRFVLSAPLQAALSTAFDQLDEREQRVAADSVVAAYGAGAIAPSELLAALPRFASAPVRQTATAGMYSTEWMAEYLIGDDTARKAFRAQVATIYRPRLDALGFDVKPGESDDDTLLRSTLVEFFADSLEDPQVRAEMNRRGRAVLGLDSDGALHADAMKQDLRGTAIEVAVEEGGVAAFDAAEMHFRASQDAALRGELLRSLGSVKDPALAARARALVLEAGLLRRNEIFAAVGGQASEEATRSALRGWVDQHFSALEARLAPAGAALVGLYAGGMCSEADAAELERRFAPRMATVEGGPLELQQTAEAVRLCGAQKQARTGLALFGASGGGAMTAD